MKLDNDQRQTVTVCCGDHYVTMYLGKTVREYGQAATRLVRLRGDGFLDRRVLVHWSRVTVIPKDVPGGSKSRLKNA